MVFQGNWVTDEANNAALFADLGSSPSTMEAARMADYLGCTPGFNEEVADAEQAYVQATLGPETTPVWVSLPEKYWEPDWRRRVNAGEMKKPVVLLKKALYGHRDSGSIWERHCDAHLKVVGFQALIDLGWRGTYWRQQYSLFLVVYVDDFKMAGPTEHLAKGWDLIQKPTKTTPGLVLGTVSDVDGSRYLGCKHRRQERVIKGRKVMTMTYDMHGLSLIHI